MHTLKNDINIIKELPSHLRSLDLEAIGSLVCYLFNFLTKDCSGELCVRPLICFSGDRCRPCKGGNT